MSAQTNNPVCGSMVVLMLMVVSTLVCFSVASPRRSIGMYKFVAVSFDGRVWERMLNPVFLLPPKKTWQAVSKISLAQEDLCQAC